MRRYVEDGLSIRQIAAETGRSYHAVREHLENDGVTIRQRGRRPAGPDLTADQRAQLRARAARLRRDGNTIAAVAAAIGCSWHVTRALLREAGLHRQRRTITSEQRAIRAALRDPATRKALRDDAAARYEAGAALHQIAAAWHYSQNTARTLVIEAGGTLRRRGAHRAAGQQPDSAQGRGTTP